MIESIYIFIGVLLATKGIVHIFGIFINLENGNFGNAAFNGGMFFFTGLIFILYAMVRVHS